MSRVTLSDAKASRLANVINISPDDPRFAEMLNEAQERLIKTGEKFWGLYADYVFCVDNECLTLPREIANVEAVAVCGNPLTIRGAWFQFLQSGPGVDSECGSGGCWLGVRQIAGEFATFADIIGENKKIKVYADVTEDAGAVITLMGYDENGQFIRTQVGGEWIDGEQVDISTTPTLSTKFFSSLVAVQKPETNGTVRLYEYDTILTTQRALAVYQPDETRPAYRRLRISGLPRRCCGNSEDGDCTTKTVNVMAKLEFIPAQKDADYLLIGNLPALKDELQSINKYECDLAQEGAFWHAKAIAGLRAELRHYLGSGVVQPIRMQPRSIAGAGVINLV